jgi:hypothetical protein
MGVLRKDDGANMAANNIDMISSNLKVERAEPDGMAEIQQSNSATASSSRSISTDPISNVAQGSLDPPQAREVGYT